MAVEVDVGEISLDGKTLICRSQNGDVRWSKGAPSLFEWRRLTKRRIDGDVAAGIFRYVERGVAGFIVAVFTPSRGLDFNLTYALDTGELIRINEAR